MASNLRVDQITASTTGSVSIGTATFTGGLSGDITGLNVTGVITATTLNQNVTGVVTATGGFVVGTGATISGSTNTITASTNGSERLRITSDGTILAGGQTASYDGGFVNLELRTDSNTVGGSMSLVNHQAAQAGATCEIDCYQNYRAAGKIVFGRENSNNWQSSAAGAASFLAFYTNSAGTNAERLRVTSGGNVGIGTDNPTEKLGVAGNIALRGSDQYVYLSNVGTGNAGMYVRGRVATSEVRSHSTGIFTWEVTGNEKMRLTGSSGDLQLANGNLVFSTSGTGIDFSATSDASGMTSELLDDYEEGTFAPNFGAPSGSAGSAAYTSDGKYVKIGKLVIAFGEIYITNKGSWSGTVTFGNLPFTAESGRQNLGSCWFTNVSVPTQTFYQSRVGPSESHATMPKISNNGGDAYMQISDITTNSSIRFTVSYTTS